MNYNLRLELIIAPLLLLIIILTIFKKVRISNSLVWCHLSLIILLLGLILNLLWTLNLFEFVTMPNLSIEIFICLLLMITNLPTVITSDQKEKNK